MKRGLSDAYDLPKGGLLKQAYFGKNLPVVGERLKLAAVRFVAVFTGAYPPSTGIAAARPEPQRKVGERTSAAPNRARIVLPGVAGAASASRIGQTDGFTARKVSLDRIERLGMITR